MSMQQQIEAKLAAAPPSHLEVINESYMHRGWHRALRATSRS